MEDNKIIALFYRRSEKAIEETKLKYGNYCKKIAFQILGITEDVEECESDTYMKLWDSIPPASPTSLKAYIGTVARNSAIQKYRYYNADKRNQHMDCVIEEIEATVAAVETVESEIARKELVGAINTFLGSLGEEQRILFVKRYWRMESIQDICKEMRISKSKAEVTLSRIRKKLKAYLEQEGYVI